MSEIKSEPIPGWAVGIMVIGGTVLVVTGSFAAVKVIKNVTAENKSKDLLKLVGNEINTGSLTFKPADYQTMADTIFQTMDGGGTSWEILKPTIVKLRTRSDWFALVQAFGVRKSSSWISTFSGNLVDWLTDELDEKEYALISERLKLIGVTI